MSVVDAAERAQALDVLHSYCVTAPAGSGKTELLIQRYLALLARVQRPEQVLAITFTRKAAAEMRQRVMEALQDAVAGHPCAGDHQRVTRELAQQALAASAREQWHLTRDVARLNIKTIDSFCAGLTRQMPVLSRFGGQARAMDDAMPLYREAVTELFALLDSARPEAADLRSLLLHFDNNWERLAELLVTMLGKRDQWNEYMGARSSATEAEQRLQATVVAVIEEKLGATAGLLEPWQGEVFDLLCYSMGNLGQPVPDEFPAARVVELPLWRAVANLFLTQGGTLRKTVNVRNGFPAGKGEQQQYKAHFLDLAGRVAAVPGVADELRGLAWLPDMSANSKSWRLVLHLSHVLPLLSACLLLVFERRGSVDHTQVALSALDALGEDEAPTELALRLDYNIEHILVDEFQDTAINQYQLVTRLTRGWGQHNGVNPDAPRTLFIVGDGMQSIYGFRNANVSLFLRARQEGFNGVIPRSLALRCNFRSEQGVVDWVNQSFRGAFPAQEDVRQGRVSFTDAVAVKPAAEGPAISLNGFYGDQATQQEASWIAEQIQAALEDQTLESIALLGRSRSQLAPVLESLRLRNIPFASQEMDPLSGSPAINDLLCICRALANQADRVAWYALLRAPWCALDLTDLEIVATAGDSGRHQNLASLLDGQLPAQLSDYGKAALQRLGQCLAWARHKRDRLALRVWVEQLWLYLGGPESLLQSRHLTDARRFFELLQEADEAGVGLDIDWLEQRLGRLFASGDFPDARVQVMTLHKSKGLEFDWVIIPALARGTRSDSRDILLWDEYNSPAGEPGFLLAADDHSDDKSPSLYNYLKRTRREKSRLETTRLLYVGATRAVSKLTLSACLSSAGDLEPGMVPELKDPPEASLLAPIWPVFRAQMNLHQPITADSETVASFPRLVRLTNPPAAPVTDHVPVDAGPNVPQLAFNRVDRHIGTVIHEILEQLSLEEQLPASPRPADSAAIVLRLQGLGLWGEILDTAAAKVEASIATTLADRDAGRWLLSSQHSQARSELALTRNRDGKAQDIVIDRTFVDTATGLRWVVDYKSSAPGERTSLQEFLAEEEQRYSEQLRDYRDTVKQFGPEPVRCALYFTSLGLLHPLSHLDAS
jgi:ATP-dependent helicase/nuclease subunit A